MKKQPWKMIVGFVLLTLLLGTMALALAENSSFELVGDELTLTSGGIYVVSIKAKGDNTWKLTNNLGTRDIVNYVAIDATPWFVDANGIPVFADRSGVAFASFGSDDSILDITLDASKISGFNAEGSGDLYIKAPNTIMTGNECDRTPLKIGSYAVPTLTVESNIFGSIFTGNTGGWKHERVIIFKPDTKATLTLAMDGLDNGKIDSSNATVALAQGSGYYPEEYIFSGTSLTGEWEDGVTSYVMDRLSNEIGESSTDLLFC